jgi:hypothetical protein
MPYDNVWTKAMWKKDIEDGKTLLGYYAWVAHNKSRA